MKEELKPSWYWSVVYDEGDCRETWYKLVNGAGDKITHHTNKDLLQQIATSHNLHFIAYIDRREGERV